MIEPLYMIRDAFRPRAEEPYHEDFRADITSRFLQIVLEQRGLGEMLGNNAGPVVASYKRIANFEEGENLGAWCASGTSWCLEQAIGHPQIAAAHFGVSFSEWDKRRHGARGLFRMAANRFGTSKNPEPGMLALWSRGKEGSWQGHISPVFEVRDEGMFMAMEFNRGGVPSRVRAHLHTMGEGGLLGFAKIV
jgi:hypothetical protein